MFLLLAAMFFLLFVRFVRRHWLRRKLCVRMKPFLYTQPCVSDHVRKTNRLFEPVDPRPSDIRVYGSGSSRPIMRRTCIRHRTYSTEVTSFLSNLPLLRIIRPCSRTRARLLYQEFPDMSIEISLFPQKFFIFFVQSPRICFVTLFRCQTRPRAPSVRYVIYYNM